MAMRPTSVAVALAVLIAMPAAAQEAAPTWAVLTEESERALAEGDAVTARTLAERARALADESAAPPLARVRIELLVGSLAAEAGDAEEAVAAFDRALALDAQARPARTTPRTEAAFALALAMRAPADAPEPATPIVGPTITEPEPEHDVLEEPVEPEQPSSALGLTLSVGVSGGFSFIGPGLPADGPRPPGLAENGPWMSCDPRGEQCTVRVNGSGFGSTLSVVIGAALTPIPRLMLGLTVHAQPGAGQGFLAGWLIDATVRGQPIEPHDFPLDLELVAAIGLGQLQVRPPQEETTQGPFVQSGPGTAAGGAAAVVRIERGVELALDVLARFAFPTFVPGLETTLVLRVQP